MPVFGARSLSKLESVDPGLVMVLYRVIEYSDFTIICGARDEAAQEEAYRTGHSRARWPESKHNAIPPGLSTAVDVAPWHSAAPHIRWDALREFDCLAGRIMQAASELDVPMRWGGDWDRDQDLYDRNIPFDLGHFERVTT